MLEFIAAILIGAVIGAAVILAADNIRDVVRDALNKMENLKKIRDALNANAMVIVRINQAEEKKVSMTVFTSIGDEEELSLAVNGVDESIKAGEYHLISYEN